MVRRWSYINQINRNSIHPYKVFQRISNESVFKETTVFRKDITTVSLVRRKSWGRRRHLNQWLLYHNILADWSQEYNFFKRYLRFLLVRSLYKHSFFLYNVLFLLPNSSGFYTGFEFINYVTVTKKVVNYCLQKNYQQWHIYQFLKHSSILYCTTNDTKFFSGKSSPFQTSLVYKVDGSLVRNPSIKLSILSSLVTKLTHINNQLVLNMHLEVYKLLVLLLQLKLLLK